MGICVYHQRHAGIPVTKTNGPLPIIGNHFKAGRENNKWLPANNSINTGPSEIILNKSPRLCHREMDASAQSRWLLESGEGTRTESRVPAAAIGARTGGERALAEATGTSAASEQAKRRTVFQGGTQK